MEFHKQVAGNVYRNICTKFGLKGHNGTSRYRLTRLRIKSNVGSSRNI